MTDYTKDAEYEVAMILSNIIQSQYIQNPNKEYYPVHLPAVMQIISSIPDHSEGIARLKFLIGSYDSMQTPNTGTALVGVGSSVYAVTCILEAKNPVSKAFYIIGASCSAVGTGISAYSGIFGNSSCYSFAGLFGIGSGSIITYIGKKCVDTADFMEGKKNKRRWFGINTRGGSARQLYSNYQNPGNIAFTLPPYLERVPYGKIFTGTIFVLTIYGYAKLIVSSYRYGQQVFSRRRNKPQLIRKQITYFVFYLWNCEKITKIRRIRQCILLKSY